MPLSIRNSDVLVAVWREEALRASKSNGNGNGRKVRKRDGLLQAFEPRKIDRAMLMAFQDATPGNIPDVTGLRNSVLESLQPGAVVDIERVQDQVELVLMRDYPEVAKAYILYREERARLRSARSTHTADPTAIADYIHPAKYARYLPGKRRRELFLETSHRSRDMHIRKFPQLEEEIRHYWRWVDEKRVLPSMRSFQFGGRAIESHNPRIYNCSFSHINRARAFQEAFYLLLCGAGVGYSVQFQHVEQLPEMGRIDKSKVRHVTIGDDIEGWSDALGAVVDAQVRGYWVEFDYSQIRPEGSPLVTSGGKAPGHLPLRNLLESARELLARASGRKLRPIECHDLLCVLANAVLAGGVRRSSLISLFSHDDGEMLYCKHPENFQHGGLNGQRALANNSVVLLRETASEEQFRRVLRVNRDNPYGEPGFFFTSDLNYGMNPCGEIGLNPALPSGEVGFSFCNLCEINAAVFEREIDFVEAAEAAAFIGTLQASYTDFPYLGKVTEVLARREALLGVGMTGIMDRPDIALNPDYQRKAAERVVETNQRVATMIGIGFAARCTTVKPSGTASLELGCVASGHHAHHARRYFRRVVANRLEPVAQYFRSINPHMVEEMPNGDWCLTFCVEAPTSAITVKEQSALDIVRAAISTKKNWVNAGTAIPESSPGLTHNVSLTVTFEQDEWDDLLSEIWRERENVSAMTFLQKTSDKGIPFVPREEVTDERDEQRWCYLLQHYTKIDYSEMREGEDTTKHSQEIACASGGCEI